MPKRSLTEESKEECRNKGICSLPEGLMDKEDFVFMSEDNLYGPVVSEQPMPIRKKRKAGANNLRKSLAWNPAFFTEQGVLDSDELSVLSGSFNEPDENFLSGRKDQEEMLLLKDSCITSNEKPELKELDNNLCKQLTPNSCTEDQNLDSVDGIVTCFRESPSPPMVSVAGHCNESKNKLVSHHSGCPRVPVSHSQKMDRNAGASNEMSKLPKPKATRPISCVYAGPKSVLSRSSLSTSADKMEKNQALQTPRDKEDKLSHFSSFAKFSPTYSKDNTNFYEQANLLSAPHLSAHTKPREVATGGVVSGKNVTSTKYAPALHAKPSRLRMPSPSLGFFAQGKVASLRNIGSQNHAQNHSLPESDASLRKLEMNSMHASAPLKTQVRATVTGSHKCGNVNSHTASTTKFSVPPSIVPSASTLYCNSEPDELMKREVTGLSNSSRILNKTSSEDCSLREQICSLVDKGPPGGGSVSQCENGISIVKPSLPETLKPNFNVKDLSKEEVKCFSSNGSSGVEEGALQCGFENTTSSQENGNTMHFEEKLVGDSKRDVIQLKLNAQPFSDVWLAAFEAAGEDILTIKSGAVQNSPPDKSLPEPNPWSPVKRNTNAGPFDCTKCTIKLPPDTK